MKSVTNKCGCTDRSGRTKKLYWERWLAEQQVYYAKKERDVVIKIYTCPSGFGYHLTSSQR